MCIRIKICGLREPADAIVAAQGGAAAIGLVFHAASPRSVEPDAARQIVRVLPPFVTSVGLFMNAGADAVRRVLAEVPLAVLQFHGEEEAAFCEQFGLPYLKAIAMGEGGDPAAAMRGHPQALGFLLDGHAPGQMGGSGRSFAWDAIPRDLPRPWLLAGGLRPENVGKALQIVQPYGVDVSSGVESHPGVKDPERIRAFIQAVRKVERDGTHADQ